jgi:hypothetical protein
MGRLDFFKANERARDRLLRWFWVSALENREVGFFGSQWNSKIEKRRRLDFFAPNNTTARWKMRKLDFLATNRTAKIEKRRRSDFLSANHRAQNEKLKRLDFFEANQKVQLQKSPSIGESSKGEMRTEGAACKRVHACHAHRGSQSDNEREEQCLVRLAMLQAS